MLSVLRRSASLSGARSYAVAASTIENLHVFKKLAAIVPREQAKIKALKTTHGEVQIGTCTVDQAYGGMRSVQSMIWETSLLDAQEGIRFRGYSIPELQKKLTKAVPNGEPLPEALLYLLLTGELPTDAETKELSQELARRGALGREAEALIDALPTSMHPMTQLSIGVMALQPQSLFAQAYSEGVHKNKLWHYAFEDSLNLIAKLPALAARIYRNVFKNRKLIERNPSLDWSANYAHMLGFNTPQFAELMRLYLTLHADHEGGNVSAHATHLVGSTLADPYYSFAAGMNGLAGPLHGLANQEVLNWMLEMQATVGKTPTDAQVEKYVWDTLNAGRVIPGFGHAVLRKTDPRYMAQREYALKHLPNDALFKLGAQMFDIVPKVLTKQGKVANPWPNVDCHSGILLQHAGLTDQSYYTVMFGVSRALGVLSQYVWSRALGFPLERPKSVTTEWLEKNISKFTK